MPTVLLIEDDDVVVDTLRLYLEGAGFDVTVARDGFDGLRLARERRPDAVVLDLMLPGLDGNEVCRQLRTESAVPILMLTARSAEDDRIKGLMIGADDYVTKPFGPREIVARIRTILRRTASGPAALPEPIRIGDLAVHVWSRQVRLKERLVSLTPTEYRVLEVLVQAAGRTFTRAELVARVFGPDFDGFDRTIDTHITNLRKKLDQRGRQSIIGTVHGVGYRIAGADDHEA